MNKKNIIRGVVAVVVVAAIIIIAQLGKKAKVVEVVEPPIRPVKVMEITDTPAQFRRVFPGRLKASQTVDLSFLTAGDLIELPVKEGQQVKKGTVLARLDARNARNAQDAARADMVLAKAELDRNRTLFKEELISAADFDVKQRAFEVAVSQLDTATKGVEDAEIRAPFDGIVAQKYVDNYQKVQAGQRVVTLFNPEGLDIIIDIPETTVNMIPQFTTEMSAVFEQNSNETYPLTVKEFASVADTYTKTYALTLFMARPKDILVIPDMTVTVNVDFKRKAHLEDENYLVPATSVIYDIDTDSSVIWTLDKDTMTVNPKTVETNRAQGGQLVITAGLEPGDTIVTAGGSFLNRDQKVRIYQP